MKVSVDNSQTWTPRRITLTLETRGEMEKLYAVFNTKQVISGFDVGLFSASIREALCSIDSNLSRDYFDKVPSA